VKQCPKCHSAALYEDTVSACPDCGAQLIPYQVKSGDTAEIRWQDIFQVTEEEDEAGGQASGARTGQSTRTTTQTKNRTGNSTRSGRTSNQGRNQGRSGGQSGTGTRNDSRTFEQRQGRRIILQGRVTEVSSGISRYQSRSHKLFNSLFRLEPYQFAHTTHRCVLWLEEENGRLAERIREVTYYGDIEGQVIPGYRMTVHAVERSGELVARTLYNDDLDQRVRGRAQIPALLVWILTLLAVALAVFLISALVMWIYEHRSLLAFLLLLWICWRIFFRRRRWR